MLALATVGCSGQAHDRYELPGSEISQYGTAYISAVVASAPDGDLKQGAGEYVVVRTNWSQRTDLGGWSVEDAEENRLQLGIGTQVDPGNEIHVHPACGETTPSAVFNCLDREVLDDDGDVLRLLDSGGAEVATFAYGSKSQ